MTHGVPCAGVLAFELLKEQQSAERTVSRAPGLRSNAIQKLVLLVAALAAVGSDEPNYAICHQYEAVLRRLVNEILEPTITSTWMTIDNNEQEYMPANVLPVDLSFPPECQMEFLQWLEELQE